MATAAACANERTEPARLPRTIRRVRYRLENPQVASVARRGDDWRIVITGDGVAMETLDEHGIVLDGAFLATSDPVEMFVRGATLASDGEADIDDLGPTLARWRAGHADRLRTTVEMVKAGDDLVEHVVTVGDRTFEVAAYRARPELFDGLPRRWRRVLSAALDEPTVLDPE